MKRLRVAAVPLLMVAAAASLVFDAPVWVYAPLVLAALAAAVWWEAGMARTARAGERDDRLRCEESIREQERFRCSRVLVRRAEDCTTAGDALRAAAFVEAAELVYLADVEVTP